MTAEHALHPDLAAFADSLAQQQRGALTIALAELAAIMRPAKPVRTIPAARWNADTILVPQNTPTQLIGKQLDRRCLTLWLVSGTACWLAPSSDLCRSAALTGTSTGQAQLTTGGGRLILATTAEVWVYSTGADSLVSWIADEYDASEQLA